MVIQDSPNPPVAAQPRRFYEQAGPDRNFYSAESSRPRASCLNSVNSYVCCPRNSSEITERKLSSLSELRDSGAIGLLHLEFYIREGQPLRQAHFRIL